MPDTIPITATGTLRTPPVVQGSVIALRTAGKSKRSIARELGINRETVDNILELYQTDKPNHAETIRELTTKAFSRVSKAIETENDTDTARWALEHTVFQPVSGDSYHVHGDVSLVNAVGMVPTGTSTHSLPSSTERTVSTGTEAGTKPGIVNLSLCVHADFFQEIAKQPPKQPVTLTCNGQALQIMRLPSSGESTTSARVIEVSPLPSSPEQGDEAR